MSEPRQEQKSGVAAAADPLSRRERQILDVLYSEDGATAAQVRERLPDAPSYSAVRALLRVLEEKGHVQHEQDGPRYVYRPVVPRSKASRSALRHLVHTFFGGSAQDAMAALMDLEEGSLSDDDYRRLREHIDAAREEGR